MAEREFRFDNPEMAHEVEQDPTQRMAGIEPDYREHSKPLGQEPRKNALQSRQTKKDTFPLPRFDHLGATPKKALTPWKSGLGARALHLLSALDRTPTGLIIEFMSPALLTPEKECYTVLIL